MANLVEDGYDLALRCSPKYTADYAFRPIAKVQFNFVASPKYIERRGSPKALSDLGHHALLWYSALPKTSSLFSGAGDPEPVAHFEPTICCDDDVFLCEAVLKGMGIAILPSWMIDPYLREGRMQKVLEHQIGPVFELVALYPSRRYLSLKVRTFIDFLVADQRLKM